jgi:histidine ammonia-lyase
MTNGKDLDWLELQGQPLTLREISRVAMEAAPVRLHPSARAKIEQSHSVVVRLLKNGQTAYGINTGFGKLSDVRIPVQKLGILQRNLVRSHACGVGVPLTEPEVRAMLLLRANVLAKGLSGVRMEVVEMLCAFLNHHIHPLVPSRGSVGASGDLAPLAHLALPLIGEGVVIFCGQTMAADVALTKSSLRPLQLEAKEGLAVLNGTQAMTAVGGLAIDRARQLVRLFDLAGAMTLEALRGSPAAFDVRVHEARPHLGQIAAAEHLRHLLEGSEIRESHRHNDPRVQDAYCLRCMPQVHGAVRGCLDHVAELIEIESGSATDNPLIFPDTDEVISGGNFHGAPLALGFDYAAIGITDLISISERRIDRLINPDLNEGLPPFLSDQPGLSSGYMIAHVVVAALLNESKVLSHPASVDNVPTSGGKEDHVSMGMTTALKLKQIVENAERVLAIELMVAAQGVEYRQPLRPSREVGAACERTRQTIPRLGDDRPISADIERLVAEIRAGAFGQWTT